jgi:hypothetical protein
LADGRSELVALALELGQFGLHSSDPGCEQDQCCACWLQARDIGAELFRRWHRSFGSRHPALLDKSSHGLEGGRAGRAC